MTKLVRSSKQVSYLKLMLNILASLSLFKIDR